MPRYLLIKNAELYAPEPMGRQDILIIGEQVAQVAESYTGQYLRPLLGK